MENKYPKLLRITTVPISLEKLLNGQLAYMKMKYDVLAVSSGPYVQLKSIGSKNKVRIKCIDMTRAINPIKDIQAIWRLYLFLKEEKPHILHSHTPKAGFIGITAGFFAGVPHKLHTVAGLPLMEAKGTKRKILEFVEKFTYRLADKIYPNSYGLKNFILQNEFCKKEKLKIIGNGTSNGIDTEYFKENNQIIANAEQLKKELNISASDFVLIFIGRIVKDKGINELLSAFNKITGMTQNMKLLLVGPFEEDLDPISDESKYILERNKKIIQCGWQEDVRPYLAASDVLVFPSYREGFPNVPMQAGAMGLPSIVTNINGCNEIIIDDVNGLIIEPKNEKALIEAILELYSNKNLRMELAANSRKMIVDRYDQKYFWSELLKEYQSLETSN